MNNDEIMKLTTDVKSGTPIDLTNGHYFIGGKVGGGISTIAKNIICQNLMTDAEIYGIDFTDVLKTIYGKRVKGVASNKKEALTLLNNILNRKNTNTVIVIDEIVDLLNVLPSEDKKIVNTLRKIKESLIKLFNTSGVRVVAFTRIPVAIIENKWFHDKINNRITLTTFKDNGIIILGDNYLGLDHLEIKENYAYLVNEKSITPTKFYYGSIDDQQAKLISFKTLTH